MSQVRVQGNASGTGVLTVTSPNTNSNYTLTLPANTGTLLTTASAGTVLQVVQGTSSTQVINNTNTYADSGLSATITPSSTSSKILVIASVPYTCGTNGGNVEINFQVLRSATGVFETISGINPSSIVQLFWIAGISYLDSPSTASSVTYKIQFKERTSSSRYGNTAVMPVFNTQSTGSIIVLEIAG